MSYPVWVVASACRAGDSDGFLEQLQKECGSLCSRDFQPTKFDVPGNLKFGSFDNLVKLVDDLAKMDNQVESVLRRVERQLLELNPDAERKVLSQRKQQTWENYVRSFPWDDAKFPRSRPISDSLTLLMKSVTTLDEEVRTRASTYNELKTAHGNASKKDASSFMARDLLDVLTPEVTDPQDFINTEHLMTVVVVVPRGQDKEFLKCYETLESNVVPACAKRFTPIDKDGNMLFRVIMFKTSLDGFKQAARQRKFMVRDFTYDAGVYKKTLEDRAATEAELKKQETFLIRVCQAAFSDTLVSWMHLKATRVFAEATLRTGAPPSFAAYAMQPKIGASNAKKLHSKMMDIFTSSGLGYGAKYTAAKVKDEDASEEYYPYIFMPFSPVC